MTVDVVVLGWRAAAQTIACLESVLHSGTTRTRIVVVDNGSDEGSDEVVWQALRRRRPDAVRVDAGAVGAAAPAASAWFVRSEVNRGYSAGMNLGLDLLRAVGRARFVWLLNNDVVVHPGAIEALVERCLADPDIGLCGCLEHMVDGSGTVTRTVPGGYAFVPAAGFAVPLRLRGAGATAYDRVERRLFGVNGAAVFLTPAFLDRVGRLGEDRFLYFEEQDTAVRARRAGLRVAWAPGAVISHVHASSMTQVPDADRVAVGRYLMSRARIVFTRRWYPWLLPSVVTAQVLHVGFDLLRGRRGAARGACAGLVDGVRRRHRRLPAMGRVLLPGDEAVTPVGAAQGRPPLRTAAEGIATGRQEDERPGPGGVIH